MDILFFLLNLITGETIMKKIKAFVLGMREFRESFTTSFEDENLLWYYDWGREIAHRLTFRYYDY